jgi:peroxidase
MIDPHRRRTLAKLALACFAIALTGVTGPTRTARPRAVQATHPIPMLRAFRPIGGRGNNRVNPRLDAVPGSPELAIVPPPPPPKGPPKQHGRHAAPTPPPGPNPRTISNAIAGGTGANGNNAETTDPVLSAWLYVFGQFVDHDLDLEETPQTNPSFNIVVPAGDPVFGPGTIIAMNRDTRSPSTNTIVNTVAGYLNLSQIYGSTPAVAASLENADGTLKSSGGGLYLPIVNGSFVTGDVRVMENPELTAVTTLFMREHNHWVQTLKAQHPTWTGTQLYGMAREITIAEYQNIVYSAYLPHLIGPVLGPYAGYNPNVNPQVTQEFSTAAFRVGHSQVSDTQEGLSSTGAVLFTESIANAFFNTPAVDIANGIDPLLRSLAADSSQATDVYTVSALRNLLFADLVGGDVDKIDLIAIDIQRERDVELGTLNQTRQALHLPPYTSFAQLTSDPVLQANFASVYGNVNAVDLFMGGLAEAHAPGANVGPTFQAIIADQFQRLRAGDSFFWLNEGFDPQTASTIANTTLATLLDRDTTVTDASGDVFVSAPVPGHRKRHVKLPLPNGG